MTSDEFVEGGKPTLEAVGALAGVSRATVSRVINGHATVKPEMVDAVNAAVAQLRYVPNRAARSLVRRRTQMIAMVIPERTAEFFADPYFAEVIQGAALYASSTDQTLTLLIESDADPEKTRRYLTGGNVDGALILSHHSRVPAYVELSDTVPMVFGVRPLEPAERPIHVVDVDNVEAAAIATRHLVARGRTSIATISGPLDTAAGIDRVNGWRSALADAGLDAGPLESGTFTPASGAEAMQRLLDNGARIDAVFAASAQMATGALEVLRAHSIRVPYDIAVASVDNNYFSTSANPPLTTVDLDTANKGAVLVQTLLRLIDGEDVPPFTAVPTALVERRSV
ncbi:LacI family DNA-binding transcriptional regulator [Conyzicola nivalis]|uniref:LacI family transcriptional regulator n=1 Tax=Conyzicola nivalis TaxID=1477021 RepID=A0A916SMK4_9MICO|nr:LacI family DNA-binding transcriptional regulator [Conyzicola nivalis]GGB07647.1 LacI family transcriptional regulator [Conyzicola nivalis]